MGLTLGPAIFLGVFVCYEGKIRLSSRWYFTSGILSEKNLNKL